MTRQPRLPPAYRLVARETVESTNSEAKHLASEEEAEDGTMVWAKHQTAGRGSRGRQWESPKGNLYCSLILRPVCTANEALQLGFVTALAIYDALGSVAPAGLEAWCKWPNDILIGDKKVSGILMECSTSGDGIPHWIVIGVGINVVSHPDNTAYPATSMRAEGCPDLTAVDMLEVYSRHFLLWFNRWQDDGFMPIRKTWLKRATRLGEAIQVKVGNEILKGTFSALDENGALVLRQNGVDRRITTGDIFPVASNEG